MCSFLLQKARIIVGFRNYGGDFVNYFTKSFLITLFILKIKIEIIKILDTPYNNIIC